MLMKDSNSKCRNAKWTAALNFTNRRHQLDLVMKSTKILKICTDLGYWRCGSTLSPVGGGRIAKPGEMSKRAEYAYYFVMSDLLFSMTDVLNAR